MEGRQKGLPGCHTQGEEHRSAGRQTDGKMLTPWKKRKRLSSALSVMTMTRCPCRHNRTYLSARTTACSSSIYSEVSKYLITL